MSPSADVIWGMAASIVVVGTAVVGLAKHFVDFRIRQHSWVPAKDVREIKDNTRQLNTNGGTHLADDIKMIKAWVGEMRSDAKEMNAKVDAALALGNNLEGKFAEHVRHHR